MKAKRIKISPQLMILITFAAVILAGTLLFLLPCATKDNKGLSFLDALFVATSATCVTGLSTISPGLTLSTFGKVVLALLIEIGGLSFLTLVSFLCIMLGVKMGVSSRFLIKEQLNQDSTKGIMKLVKKIIITTLSIQLIGAIASMLIFFFKYHFSFAEALGVGIFHSISAFNNAGFDIFTNAESSMISYKDDPLLNIVTMILIILGGIGFIVMDDIMKKKKWSTLELHTKVVLVTSLVLMLGGALLFKLFMWSEMSVLEACFTSVTARTAGFATIDMATLEGPSYILMIFLMFVGASPCSTGGGFKTTSLAVLVITLISFIRGTTPKAFSRKIPENQIMKTFALFTLEIAYLIVAIMIIGIIEKYAGSNIDIKSLIFETVSAFATVGVSQGITSSLQTGSKIVIILTMFIGRLGPLSIVSLWDNRHAKQEDKNIRYVDGKIIVG